MCTYIYIKKWATFYILFYKKKEKKEEKKKPEKTEKNRKNIIFDFKK